MQQIVYDATAPQRLDNFIRSISPALSQGLLHKYMRQNKIKLNGKKMPLSTLVGKGDVVCLYLPPPDKNNTPDFATQLTIIYEDESLLVLNKPAGLICQTAADLASDGAAYPEEDSLLRRSRAYIAQNAPSAPADAFTPLLCHRLDTGTSGLVLVAKTAEMLNMVTELIRERLLCKVYYGVSVGHPDPSQGNITAPLFKNAALGLVQVAVARTRGARQAETRYKTLATSGPLALLEMQLVTGRTHQLRVHLAHFGTPLLGDSKYGNQAANRRLRCRYQCLCAGQVSFPSNLPFGFEAYEGLVLQCEKPWYYTQIEQGVLT